MIGSPTVAMPRRALRSALVTVVILLAGPGHALLDAIGPGPRAPAVHPIAPCTADASPPTVMAQWRHPVDAPVVDGFRMPSNPYGPGNRGLEYGTTDGAPVVAVADGTVTFAGSVGRSRFVVVQHRDGLKSTYGYLLDIDVDIAPGRDVVGGQPIATAKAGFHLTARWGDTYLDPLLFMIDGCFFVRLVPVPSGPAGAVSTGIGDR